MWGAREAEGRQPGRRPGCPYLRSPPVLRMRPVHRRSSPVEAQARVRRCTSPLGSSAYWRGVRPTTEHRPTNDDIRHKPKVSVDHFGRMSCDASALSAICQCHDASIYQYSKGRRRQHRSRTSMSHNGSRIVHRAHSSQPGAISNDSTTNGLRGCIGQVGRHRGSARRDSARV